VFTFRVSYTVRIETRFNFFLSAPSHCARMDDAIEETELVSLKTCKSLAASGKR
jgi:hypothetical protein